MKYRTSPERYSFHIKMLQKSFDEGGIVQKDYDRLIDFWNNLKKDNYIPTTDLPDLESDLRSSDLINYKCSGSEKYCQELYAAICNNQFIKHSKECSYTWRMVGGIIANILEKGDYIDWYLSGNEGYISEEVSKDLSELGWVVKETSDDMDWEV